MRGKQHGAPVRLNMRYWDGERPGEGDFLVTDAGSGYLIVDANGWHENGQGNIDCIKFHPDHIPLDARVFDMVWVPRGRRR